MIKLEKLPYLLRAFILFALFGDVAGLGGAIFNGLAADSLGAIALILMRGGRYHIMAEEFLGIPGITVISYEKQHREDSFVEDLL